MQSIFAFWTAKSVWNHAAEKAYLKRWGTLSLPFLRHSDDGTRRVRSSSLQPETLT